MDMIGPVEIGGIVIAFVLIVFAIWLYRKDRNGVRQ